MLKAGVTYRAGRLPPAFIYSAGRNLQNNVNLQLSDRNLHFKCARTEAVGERISLKPAAQCFNHLRDTQTA
jgi:hypothetical protein